MKRKHFWKQKQEEKKNLTKNEKKKKEKNKKNEDHDDDHDDEKKSNSGCKAGCVGMFLRFYWYCLLRERFKQTRVGSTNCSTLMKGRLGIIEELPPSTPPKKKTIQHFVSPRSPARTKGQCSTSNSVPNASDKPLDHFEFPRW